jgi:acetoacetyl-CoA synthetase
MLFVVLAPNTDLDMITATVRSRIRTMLSPRHVPNRVIPVPALPHTLNGKKCEVPVKRILAGADPEAVISRDALADPDGFDRFLLATVHSAGHADVG